MPALFQSALRMAASSSRAEASRTHVRLKAALTVLVVVNAVLVFFLFRSPGLSEAQRRQQIARLEAEQRSAERRVQQLTELRQKVQDATKNEQLFAQKNFLPRQSAFSAMLSDLERLAKDNRLEPGDVNYKLDEKSNQLGWTNVSAGLTLEGAYPDLLKFLNQLEKSELFWIIEGLEVSGATGAGLRLKLEASTYLLPS
jgi:Tfp pilus assembly protein PilO